MRFTSTAILAVGLLASSALRAEEEHACKQVKSSIITSFIACPADFPSPVNMCTVGTVASGPLKGTTRFRALSIALGPVPKTVVYTGELIITTKHGTLTINDTGLLDLGTGAFVETDLIVHGTGRFEEATGTLVSNGFDIGTGFVGSIGGSVCLEGHREGDREHDREHDRE